jgi:hypothetical protein
MFTYITTTTVPSFPTLQEKYAATLAQINWTVAISMLSRTPIGRYLPALLQTVHGITLHNAVCFIVWVVRVVGELAHHHIAMIIPDIDLRRGKIYRTAIILLAECV